MSIEITLIVLTVVLTLFMLGGVWTAFSLGITGIIVIFMTKGEVGLHSIGSILYNSTNSYLLVAVPLFLFMGEIILRSGVSGNFYRGVAVLVRRLPGGLLHANILSCSIFSAVSGSSVATAAAVGTVAIPEMIKRGYDPKVVYGSLASGGTLGILIPPSLAMVLYGVLVDVSIPRLFMAGILPGLLMAGVFMIFIALQIAFNPSLAPQHDEGSFTSNPRDVLHVIPIVLLLLAVLGGIYAGVATPTEAAAIGVAGALLLAAASRQLTAHVMSEAIADTVKLTCMITAIVVGAQILAYGIVYSDMGREVAGLIVEMELSRWTFFFLMVIFYLFLGTFVDGISMIYMTIPVLLPTIQHFEFDLVWMGIILVILIEIAQITPPVGLNLFTIQAIAKRTFGSDAKGSDVSKGSLPYVFLMLLVLMILAIWPEIVLWVPDAMSRR